MSVVRFARRDKLVSALEHACRAVSDAEMIFCVFNLLDFAVGQADKVFCEPLFFGAVLVVNGDFRGRFKIFSVNQHVVVDKQHDLSCDLGCYDDFDVKDLFVRAVYVVQRFHCDITFRLDAEFRHDEHRERSLRVGCRERVGIELEVVDVELLRLGSNT